MRRCFNCNELSFKLTGVHTFTASYVFRIKTLEAPMTLKIPVPLQMTPVARLVARENHILCLLSSVSASFLHTDEIVETDKFLPRGT